MDSVSSNLDFTLRSLSKPDAWPMPLPLSHLSVARYFDSIVDKGELTPRNCSVFNQKLIYLFYGGVFYRTSNKPTRNAAELPIAFLFNPTVLQSAFRYYPFDTGALASGRYGNAGERLLPFEQTYAVSGGDVLTPSMMVYHLYITNRRYLRGDINEALTDMPLPLADLAAFFGEDLSELGVDQRQALIECHSKDSIALNRDLLWVGFPDSMTDIFARLYDLTKPSIPDYFAYESHVIFNPLEIAGKLEARAAEVVERFKELPKAKGA